MPDFTARTPEELSIVTTEADAVLMKHMEYYRTSEDACFRAAGINSTGDCIETFLKVRTVTNRTASRSYCMIWLFTGDDRPTVRSHCVQPYSREATADAFNRLLDGHRHCHWSNDQYVEAIARLYRPDLRACRIV